MTEKEDGLAMTEKEDGLAMTRRNRHCEAQPKQSYINVMRLLRGLRSLAMTKRVNCHCERSEAILH